MQRTLLLVLLLAVLASSAGCGMFNNDRADLLAARQSYTAAVNTLAMLRAQSSFTASQGKAIEEAAEAALDVLDLWEAELRIAEERGEPVNRGRVTAIFADRFRFYLRQLLAAQLAGERYLSARKE